MSQLRKKIDTWWRGPTSGSDAKVCLEGKIVAITGANTGIGRITAHEISKKGARVIMLCRNTEKAHSTAKEINKNTGNQVDVVMCDLASFESIRECADTLLEKEDKIDILINNAGVMACPEMKTKDGLELQIGTNHFGHFLLTDLLQPLLRKSSATGGSPRIVIVSSMAHEGPMWPWPFCLLALGIALFIPKMSKVYWALIPRFRMNWEDLHFQNIPGSYKTFIAYSQSKLANVLHAKELSRRVQKDGISVYCVHPGLIDSELWRHHKAKGSLGEFMLAPFEYLMKTTFHGAQTTLYCALEPSIAKDTGLYYSDCKEASPSPVSLIEEDQKKLWNISEETVGNGTKFNI